jgi:hypothetical protein
VSHAKLATLGLNPLAIVDALQKQNAMSPAGFYETPSDRVRIRVSGDFESLAHIREIGIQAAGACSAWATSPPSSAVSPTRRRRACASRGRTRSASALP